MSASGTVTPAVGRPSADTRRSENNRPALRVVCAAGTGRVRPGIVERVGRVAASVVEAPMLSRAFEDLKAGLVDVCIVDLTAGSSVAPVRMLRAGHPDVALIGVADPTSPEDAGEAMQSGLSALLPWPFEDLDLLVALTNLGDRLPARSGYPELPEDGNEPLFAQSPAMRDVMEQAAELAPSRAGLILRGESGTGRSILARTIHRLGGRARPFVDVDCGDGAPQDIERRLFGVVLDRPSAKPDAASALRVGEGGAIVMARGGTLYLRNVTELPARVQSTLARLLRDREAWLGNGRTLIDLDVRPIAALDGAADDVVAVGRLQADLYERLSQGRIDLAPLRRRREDIPALAAWRLRRVCRAAGVTPKAFSRSALALLTALPWHGNGREFEDMIDRTVRGVSKAIVQIDDLLEHTSLDGLSARVETGVTLREARARFERDCISAVLRRHHGRVGDAAKALGIQRTNLYRKVRQLNVPRSLLSARK